MRNLGAGSREILDKSSRMGVQSAARERELIIRSQGGDREAINELVMRNVRLVVRHIPRYTSDRVCADDAFICGIMGLIRAAEKSDIEKWDIMFSRMSQDRRGKGEPSPFYIYSQHWIRREMGANLFKYDSQVHRGDRCYNKEERPALSRLQQKAKNGPCIDKVLDAQARGREYKYGGETASNMYRVSIALSEEPDTADIDIDAANVMRIAEDVLTEREYNILMRRIGVGLDERDSLERLGIRWGICKERVRQIYNESLAKVRKELCVEVS